MAVKQEVELIHELEIVRYKEQTERFEVALSLDPGTETIWATQAQIAELFATSQPNVSIHLSNIFAEEELVRESNIKKFNIATSTRPVTVYSLDAIISVGYRVNSKAATRFRQWATSTLKSFVEQGYVLNEQALRNSPQKLDELAARIRSLRSEEKHVYAKVRDCFKISASDYDPSSTEVRRFYALLQDKFHYAVTDMTSSKLILDRADHAADNMGLIFFSGIKPSKAEAMVGKNYLTKEELYRLHILSEQFLLFAEGTALAGKKMTMASLHEQLDRLLTLNHYRVFDGWKDYLKEQVKRHVEAEYAQFQTRLKIEEAGRRYDPIAMEDGQFADILGD